MSKTILPLIKQVIAFFTKTENHQTLLEYFLACYNVYESEDAVVCIEACTIYLTC